MARRKGSKNRTTLERELTEAGVVGDLTKLKYNELAAKVEKVPKPLLPAPVLEPVEKSIIDPELARTVIEDARRRFDIMVNYYTTDEDAGLSGVDNVIPERIQEFLRLKVFMASSVDDARQVARKALDKLHTHLLVLWSSKRISGPSTAENIARRAAKMEKWARRLEALKRPEEARRQFEKAAEVRKMTPSIPGTPWAT